MSDPVPITDALDRVVTSLRGSDRRELGGLFGRWEEAVGHQISSHVRPIKLDAGTLLVEADDPAWATQVKFLTDTILDRLASVAGVHATRVDVRVASSARRR